MRAQPRSNIRGVALLASLILATPALAQDRVSVRGVVVDRSSGYPIVGAAVGMSDSRQVAFSDENGNFVLDNVLVGRVLFQAEQLGYSEWSAERSITTDPEPLRIELQPDPVVLEGIQVTSDRLRARRNAIAASVRAYEADQIRSSTAFDAFDFIRQRTTFTPCRPGLHGSYCVLHRGRYVYPRVYLDDAPWYGGLDTLQGLNTYDIYLIEVIGRTHIRVYTQHFARLLATGRTRLAPVLIF